jgi:hypothetical protein
MFIVANVLGEGSFEGSKSKGWVFDVKGEEMNNYSLAMVNVPDKEFKGN